MQEVWAQAAMARTVRALPQLHPWRLGDTTGSSRLLQWVGRGPSAGALVVLAITAQDPSLEAGENGGAGETDFVLTGIGAGLTARDLMSRTTPAPALWAGALVRLPGSWLPPIAWLPRATRGWDDPDTAWPTESVEFDQRYSVHASDLWASAALLTPAVMALLLDAVPPGCALSIAGDAAHLWWPHRGAAAADVGRCARAAAATARVVASFPRFVIERFPDRSDVVQTALDQRVAAAGVYRAGRRPGQSIDPVLQRIYDQASD